MSSSSGSVKVAVRVRPLIAREVNAGGAEQWITSDQTIQADNNASVSYTYDHVFGTTSCNQEIYSSVARPLVQSAMQGYNGTIFAYGQTASGKTHTIMGDEQQEDSGGLISHAVADIFEHISKVNDRKYLLHVIFLELYNEELKDLLNPGASALKIREREDRTIFVQGITKEPVCEQSQVLELLRRGLKSRQVAGTNMNERSSRSHSIFRIVIESAASNDESQPQVTVSELNIVDLAGSERVAATGASGQTFREGVAINQSLSQLTNVISRLADSSTVRTGIDYRSSKLTRILQNSLGGNALTAIVCNVTPANIEETESTLKFAQRAKRVRNCPIKNVTTSLEETMFKKYQIEVEQQRQEIVKLNEKISELSTLQTEKERLADFNEQLFKRNEAYKKKLKMFLCGPKRKSDTVSREQLVKARRQTWCPRTSQQPLLPSVALWQAANINESPAKLMDISEQSNTSSSTFNASNISDDDGFSQRNLSAVMKELMDEEKEKVQDVQSPGSIAVPHKRFRPPPPGRKPTSRLQFQGQPEPTATTADVSPNNNNDKFSFSNNNNNSPTSPTNNDSDTDPDTPTGDNVEEKLADLTITNVKHHEMGDVNLEASRLDVTSVSVVQSCSIEQTVTITETVSTDCLSPPSCSAKSAQPQPMVASGDAQTAAPPLIVTRADCHLDETSLDVTLATAPHATSPQMEKPGAVDVNLEQTTLDMTRVLPGAENASPVRRPPIAPKPRVVLDSNLELTCLDTSALSTSSSAAATDGDTTLAQLSSADESAVSMADDEGGVSFVSATCVTPVAPSRSEQHSSSSTVTPSRLLTPQPHKQVCVGTETSPAAAAADSACSPVMAMLRSVSTSPHVVQQPVDAARPDADQVAQLQEHIARLEELLKAEAVKHEVENISNENARLLAENEQLRHEKQHAERTLSDERERLEAQSEQLDVECHALRLQLADKQQAHDNMLSTEARLSELTERASRLETQLAEQQDNARQAQEQAQLKQTRLHQLQTELDSQKAQYDESRAELSSAQQKLAATEAELDALRKKEQEAAESAKAALEQLQATQAKLDDKTTLCDQLTQIQQTAATATSASHSDNSIIDVERHNCSQLLLSPTHAAPPTAAQLAAIQAERDKAKAQLAEMTSLANAVVIEKDALADELRAKADAMDALERHKQQVEEDLECLRASLNDRDKSYVEMVSFLEHEKECQNETMMVRSAATPKSGKLTPSRHGSATTLTVTPARAAHTPSSTREQNFKHQLIAHEERVKVLEKDLVERERMLVEAGQDLAEFKRELISTKTHLDRETERHNKLKEELRVCSAELETAKEKLAEAHTAAENAKKDVADYEWVMEEEKKRATRRIGDLQKQCAELGQQLDAARASSDADAGDGMQQSEVEELIGKLAEAEEQLGEVRAQVAADRQTLATRDEAVDALQTKLNQAVEKCTSLQQELDQINDGRRTTDEQCSALQRDLTSARAELEETRAKLTGSQAEIEQLKRLQQDASTLNTQLAEVQQREQDLNAQLNELRAELSTKNNELARLRTDNHELREERDCYKESSSELLAEAVAKGRQHAAELEQLEARAVEADRRCQAKADALAEFEHEKLGELASLNTELAALRDQLEQQQAAGGSTQQQGDAQQQVVALTAELADVRREFEQQQQVVALLRKKKKKLEDACDAADDLEAECNKRIEEMQLQAQTDKAEWAKREQQLLKEISTCKAQISEALAQADELSTQNAQLQDRAQQVQDNADQRLQSLRKQIADLQSDNQYKEAKIRELKNDLRQANQPQECTVQMGRPFVQQQSAAAGSTHQQAMLPPHPQAAAKPVRPKATKLHKLAPIAGGLNLDANDGKPTVAAAAAHGSSLSPEQKERFEALKEELNASVQRESQLSLLLNTSEQPSDGKENDGSRAAGVSTPETHKRGGLFSRSSSKKKSAKEKDDGGSAKRRPWRPAGGTGAGVLTPRRDKHNKPEAAGGDDENTQSGGNCAQQ